MSSIRNDRLAEFSRSFKGLEQQMRNKIQKLDKVIGQRKQEIVELKETKKQKRYLMDTNRQNQKNKYNKQLANNNFGQVLKLDEQINIENMELHHEEAQTKVMKEQQIGAIKFIYNQVDIIQQF